MMVDHMFKWAKIISAVICLLILVDFTLPGKEYTEGVLEKERKMQRYYNAAQNVHYSHHLITKNFILFSSEDLANIVNKGDMLLLKESRLFKEINRVTHIPSATSEIYSLRYVSGLVIPLLAILVFMTSLIFPTRYVMLSFVLIVLSTGNLIYILVS
ncbi:hypothetical protein [Gangjinia marincola]|uniref:hypothetical protein n=1 Tax=Gangjinia marincola TaxID=578463 RepID=UPI0031DE8EC3